MSSTFKPGQAQPQQNPYASSTQYKPGGGYQSYSPGGYGTNGPPQGQKGGGYSAWSGQQGYGVHGAPSANWQQPQNPRANPQYGYQQPSQQRSYPNLEQMPIARDFEQEFRDAGMPGYDPNGFYTQDFQDGWANGGMADAYKNWMQQQKQAGYPMPQTGPWTQGGPGGPLPAGGPVFQGGPAGPPRTIQRAGPMAPPPMRPEAPGGLGGGGPQGNSVRGVLGIAPKPGSAQPIQDPYAGSTPLAARQQSSAPQSDQGSQQQSPARPDFSKMTSEELERLMTFQPELFSGYTKEQRQAMMRKARGYVPQFQSQQEQDLYNALPKNQRDSLTSDQWWTQVLVNDRRRRGRGWTIRT